ncbi:transcription factor/nuclear export subunit protein 2-domain-containing protein [Pseudomassariella vexata]|uniref:THO complex subunit 2 n=1 Tax=Pseudomassariella vexata TaxID=1141098 RepID=A0A1Y2E2Y3_9PEZI|nr:transcription factor/nuclear export subunit protein 2-domain-containing protein [Pseudomassariella vexata]ORY65225.1 transcription factor/nuclear export subunit protein 2-domain-containing protein [Pseudomassariella vexata]
MPPKRKRNEMTSEAGGARPSPHRPSNTTLAQHERDSPDSRRRSGAGRNTRGRNAERRDSAVNQLNTVNANAGNANSRAPVSPSFQRPASSSSQKSPAIAPAQQTAPSANQPPSNAVASNYNYVVLTDSRLAVWQQSGRQEVVQHGITSKNDEDVEEITTITQEFARAALDVRLNPGDAGACMKEILGPEPETDNVGFGFDAHGLFVDTISIFIETEDGCSKPQLRDFILAAGLSPKLLRQALDPTLLQYLGLTRSHFPKMGIRFATNQLYRQSNYNLLREESEGFSKLITDLYWTPHSLNQENLTREDVEAGFERVKGLIGTFDLDVGRVLDIVFDVFASTMMRTFRYYTMFLRVSSWWPRSQIERYDPIFTGGLPRWAVPGANFMPSPEEKAQMDEQRLKRDMDFWERAREVHLDAFFEIGGRQTNDAELERFANASTDVGLKTDFEIEWAKVTKTLPPTGNRVAAQLFGFKLRYYTSDARDKDEIIPANLFYLAAYLIKVGFFSLPDLYAHLWPDDAKMDAVKEKRIQELEEKEKKDRQGLEPNALLRAGALPDDTAPTTTSRTRESAMAKPEAGQNDANGAKVEEESLPEPAENLKMDLVQHLLLVGAIPEALFMLGRFPWLIDAYPEEIILPINRILLHSIEKVYEKTQSRAAGPPPSSLFQPDVALDQTGVAKGYVRLGEREAPKVYKWPHANGYNRGIAYEHYLKEWSDNVPICQTVDDVFTLCATFLNVSGVNVGRTPALLKKLTAIGAMSLQQDQSQHNIDRWQDLLRRIIIPALNLSSSNVDVVNAVWGLLKHYPTHVRYNIYAECYEGQISRLPAMAKAFKYARLDTLAILKRLSLQNLANSAKHLAKVALFAPGVVCKVALDQIEAYSNLIEAFVECAKYFTELGHDVLVWSLMSSLGGKQRSRTQESSVLLTSKWLQALSKFSGKVFRRYGNMDSTPVIQYVNDQLARGNSTDLVILRELITSMGGIVSDIDFTDAQLAALSGGEELRRQTLINLGDHRFESQTTRSAARFMKALVHSKFAPRLLTNIAQYRQSAIYRLPENETHIKFLATVIDDSQQALAQFVELLRSNLAPDQFDNLVPSIPRLMSEFGLDANLAFLIGRASLAFYLTGPGATAPKDGRVTGASEHVTDAEGDVSMDVKDGDDASLPLSESQASDDQVSPVEQDNKGKIVRKTDRFLEVLHPIIDAVQTLLPSEVWQLVSPEFYVLFWSLQTGDLGIPASSYNAESIRLQKEQEHIKRDRSDMSRAGTMKREQRKQEITQLATKLSTEASQCQERVGKTRMLLLKSAPTWLPAVMAKCNAVADTIIEECLMPRILLSPGDADFSHKMVKFLHEYQVANFKITALYERFFSVNRLRSMIFGCTVREAEFFGRFIKLTLGELSRWHKSKDIYEKEAVKGGKHVGFATALDDEGKPVSVMDHGQFRDLLWSWHRNLATALRSCLQGTEWMHIRNSITILKAVLDYFPAVDFQGKQFMQMLQKIAERESTSKGEGDDGPSHRVDLSVTANTAASALKKHESKWVMVQAFRPNTVGLFQIHRGIHSSLTIPQTGDPTDDKRAAEASKGGTPSSNLRPNALEFRPPPTLAVHTKATTEDEDDGEVRDNKSQPASTTHADERKDSDAMKAVGSQKPAPVPPRTAELARSSSRPSTPTSKSGAPSPGTIARREASKPSILASLPPGLPSRPDVPFPSHFAQDERGHIRLPTEHPHPRDARDTREHREPRNSREPREARELRETREARPAESTRATRGRDSHSSDRRAPTENVTREAPRSDRDRLPPRSEGSARWETSAHDREGRPSRDRALPPSNAGRGSESSRPPREPQSDAKVMPPPAPPQPETQGPSVNPERARLIGTDEMINPARVALIHESRPAGRQPKDETRERSTRHGSPPRRGERSEPRLAEPTREERPSRSHRGDHQTPSRDSRNEAASTNGPRGDRGERDVDRPMPDRSRDLGSFQGPTPGPRGEPDGRATQQDPNYGRLNAIPSITDMSNAPDAPRGRGRNAARAPPSSSQPPSRTDGRFPNADQSHRGPSPDRQLPPTGPASSRQRRGPAGPAHNAPVTSPAPVPATTTTPGIHPDRLRHLAGSGLASTPSPAPPTFTGSGGSSVNSVGVHPDRMNHIHTGVPPTGPSQGRSLPPLQTPDRALISSGNSNSRQASSGHPMTPSTDKSNSMSAPPTGPSATNDRHRTGSRRQLAGINNVLRDASGPDPMSRVASLRGRSSRSNLAGSDAQILTGASPISTPVHERPDPIVNDRGGDHPGSARGGANGDDRSGRSEHVPAVSNIRGEPNGRGDGVRDSRHRNEGGTNGRHDEHGRSGGARVVGNGPSGGPRGGEDHRSREPRGGEEVRGSRKRRSEEGGYAGPTPDGHKRQRQR